MGTVAWKGETITLFPMLQVMLEGLIYQEIWCAAGGPNDL